ncbi:alanine racemase [Rubrobacter indicoceani]|uniref:alanine racemase n=1 Tax=Rubrobacter indicoceani TaxID=2051957 RepID=UPI000E5BC171|nr:alanine racemase [Rubrobacter indicoceani]
MSLPPSTSRTWADVDLSALRHNIRALRRRANGSQMMAVVKADAYGHGASEVARAAVEAGAESLAVVTVEEGAELRESGAGTPILVFTDLHPEKLPLARSLDLAVTAHSVRSARLIAGVPGLRAHLKVNTGMNRWGIEPEEVGAARRILGEKLVGVYTHFASADSDGIATEAQVRVFNEVLAAHPFGGALVHAANSAATLWQPAARYDLVRPGVALYGLHPAGGDPAAEDLRPVMSLKSYVAGVRRLAPGDGVSYGLTFRASGEVFAATVPVGYAEGYRRTLSGRSEALIGGVRRRLLGRVTMDASVFECDPDTEVGDEVVLFGSQGEEAVSAEEVAGLAGTINYEITTGVNPRRVERRFI